MFTFHQTTADLIHHWTDEYSPKVEHVAIVVALVHEEPRSFIGYYVLDVPNRAKNKRSYFAIRRSEALDRAHSLFKDGTPPPGIEAGMVAVMHTHPGPDVGMPTHFDLNGVAEGTLGIVVSLTRGTARWYNGRGIIARPPAIAPHPMWRLPMTERSTGACTAPRTTAPSIGSSSRCPAIPTSRCTCTQTSSRAVGSVRSASVPV